MYYFFVAHCKESHDKFWELSWYELGLYFHRQEVEEERFKQVEEAKWARFRIQWADFRNVNRSRRGKVVKPEDLVKLSYDTERKVEYHEIDMNEMKRRFGSKIKRKHGK